jgi:hypothetical protein
MILLYRVSIQKNARILEFLKNRQNIGKVFFYVFNGLLRTTGAQIPAYIFRLPHRPPLGPTNSAHVEVY